MADCSTCTAYVPLKEAGLGQCKAHPPTPVVGLHYGQAGSGVPEVEYIFPVMSSGDWCREHIAVAPPPLDSPPA